MSYQRIGWEDYPSTNTKVNAQNLNHQEQGIVDNENAIRSVNTELVGLRNTVSEMRSDIQGEIDDGGEVTGDVAEKVNKILTEVLLDGRLNMQQRTPNDTKMLNGTLYGSDPYRFSVTEGGGNHYTSDRTISLETGSNARECSCQGSIGGTATVTIKGLATAAVYLLVCAAHTIATGAFYAVTARLVTTRASGGTNQNAAPNITSLGGGNPATIAGVADNRVTIKNTAAVRLCQFSLMRLM